MLPFTVDEFFGVFRQYNEAVWPAQVALLALGVAGIALMVRGRPDDPRRVSGILALLWLWMAVVYHLTFFTRVNPAAWIFAIAFAIQGLLLAASALRPERPTTASSPRFPGGRAISIALLAYALLGYPVLGWMIGHRYPTAPTFGVPCPTTIYTLGILAWRAPAVRWWLLVIPVGWAVVGIGAAVGLGVLEDLGLPVAAALALAAVALGHGRRAARYATGSAA